MPSVKKDYSVIASLRLVLAEHGVEMIKIKDRLLSVENKIDLLPTKNDFFNKMDKVLAELKAVREGQKTMSNQIPRVELS